MAFLFRSKEKSDAVEDDLSKAIAQIKLTIQGTQETDISPEQVSQLVNGIISKDLLYLLAKNIHRLTFEARKDSQAIFSYVFRHKPVHASQNDHSLPPAISYVVNSRPEIIIELCCGYDHRESAMQCGTVLREALKYEDVAIVILYGQSGHDQATRGVEDLDLDTKQSGEGVFWHFFDWIDKGAFEVSTDAFTTFREILIRHKKLVAHYLAINFDLFFSKYNSTLILSQSYVTKRQSIKLLGEILLDRSNYNVMTAYVDRGDHLKLCMNLLKDDRKMVQYEGFHVFKVFVANPKKSVAVQKILLNNRERLLRFLPVFLADRTDDDQFNDEKSFLIRQIETMPANPTEPA